MRWTKEDTTLYLPEKQYVDTVIIPVIPFDPSSDDQMIKQAFQSELNQVFTNVMEKNFKGRIFLSPNYNYIDGQTEKEVERMNHWIEQFRTQPFQHIFLFTFDSGWKKHESNLDANLLWVPGIRKGNIQSTDVQSFVKEQAQQITELIQSYW